MTLIDADVKRDPVLGEDTWELFEVIEDSFGVDLGDYYAICGITLRELAELISRKANHPTEEKCLSAVAFYKLRRALEILFDIPRTAIRPATSVVDLLPLKHRSTRWQMLQEHLGLTLPRLQFPGWLLLLALVTPPALLFAIRAFLGARISVIWIFDGSFALYWITLVSIIPAIDKRFPLARVLPKSCETFGGLVTVISAHNYAAVNTPGRAGGLIV
ncbi:MAG: hypothetical protein ABSE99_16500 [Terracidiphilus sp.]|jgi:hypothetical protein